MTISLLSFSPELSRFTVVNERVWEALLFRGCRDFKCDYWSIVLYPYFAFMFLHCKEFINGIDYRRVNCGLKAGS
jgi:hypothetical protein